MTKQRYQVRNWKDYNKRLVRRGSITFWFSEEVIKNWRASNQKKQKGRPFYYSEMAILCALTFRQLFRLPLRATEGLVGSILELMKLEAKTPNYTTLCRRGKKLSIDLGGSDTHKARHVLVDSTGVRVVGEGEWKRLKHGESRCQVWRKLHLTIDAADQMILSAEMSESVRTDGTYLPQLLESIAGDLSSVTGDGAYDKKGCYRAIHEREAKALVPPQRNAIVQRNKIKKRPSLGAARQADSLPWQERARRKNEALEGRKRLPQALTC